MKYTKWFSTKMGLLEYRDIKEAYVLKCNSDKDALAKKGAMSILNQDYDVLNSNCAQVAQVALKKAGFDDGSKEEHFNIDVKISVLGHKIPIKNKIEAENFQPNTIYEFIKKNNPNGTIIKADD